MNAEPMYWLHSTIYGTPSVHGEVDEDGRPTVTAITFTADPPVSAPAPSKRAKRMVMHHNRALAPEGLRRTGGVLLFDDTGKLLGWRAYDECAYGVEVTVFPVRDRPMTWRAMQAWLESGT